MGEETTTITPRDFRFYAHDIELIRYDGAHVPMTLVHSAHVSKATVVSSRRPAQG